MNTKHTPGPWRELVTRIDDANGYQLCHLDLHGKSEAERDANRRLIAAAPALLSALQTAEACLHGHGKPIDPAITAALELAVGAAYRRANRARAGELNNETVL
jgi:hypothetical protein